MARKYFPELGDVVSYKDKRVVIVHIENNCTAYPVYFYSFLDESLIHNYSFIETDELLEVTPKSLRIRKKILDPLMRKRANRNN